MYWTLLAAGLIVTVFTAVDALRTTVHIGRGGLITRGTTRLFGLMSRGHRSSGGSLGGMIIPSVIVLWTLGLWLGWSLIFCSHPHAVLNATTHLPAGLWDRVYFAGFSLITLGVGDMQPGTVPAQFATVVSAFSGLFLITAAITFATPIYSAFAQTRQLAHYIYTLGSSGERIVSGAWNGRRIQGLNQHLTMLTPMLLMVTHQQRTYPLLHQFRSFYRESSLAASVACLHEAVLLLEAGVAEDLRPPPAVLNPLRRALEAMINQIVGEPDCTSQEAGSPSTKGLAQAGVPLADQGELYKAARQRAGQRRALRAWVERQGFEWRAE